MEKKKKKKAEISGNSRKPITSARGFIRIICGSSVNSLLAVSLTDTNNNVVITTQQKKKS